MLDSLGAIKELYEASKGGEVLAAINHAAKMTTSTLPFTGFSRSQIRSIPTRYDVLALLVARSLLLALEWPLGAH